MYKRTGFVPQIKRHMICNKRVICIVYDCDVIGIRKVRSVTGVKTVLVSEFYRRSKTKRLTRRKAFVCNYVA